MENQKVKIPVAGILMAVYSVICVISLFFMFIDDYNFSSNYEIQFFVETCCYILLTVFLFLKKRGGILLLPIVGVILLNLLRYFDVYGISFLFNIFETLGLVLLFVIVFFLREKKFENPKFENISVICRKLFFIPSMFFVISSFGHTLIVSLVLAVAIFFFCYWMANPYGRKYNFYKIGNGNMRRGFIIYDKERMYVVIEKVIAIIVGIIIVMIGRFLIESGNDIQIPGGALTTYESLDGEDTDYHVFDNKYSSIDEYVGGDAYNYIIGATLVSGKISSATIIQAIYIVGGYICICIGLLLAFLPRKAVRCKEPHVYDVPNVQETTHNNIQ